MGIKTMHCKIFVAAGLLVMGGFTCPCHAEASQYRIANRFHLDGDGGWDLLAVDEASGRVFISHSSMVQVLNPATGKVDTIPDTKGVHGIALAPDLNKGFTSDGKDSTVTIFDLKTLAVLTRVLVTGQNPDAILYDDFSQRVFAFNGKSNNATVIDAKTDSVVGTVALPGRPELAVSDGKGTVYANIEDSSWVAALDPKTLKVLHTWPIAPGQEPSGLAMDRKTNRLFIACSNKLMVVLDPGKGKVVTSLPIGDKVDGSAFDSATKRAYTSNGDGTLTVVQEYGKNKFEVVETVVTQKGARTLAVDSKTHHIYLPTAEFGPAPDPTPEHPKPRPAIKPGSFTLLDVEPAAK